MKKNKKIIKNFVQQVLGCTCPEKVFDNIQWEEKEKILEIDISNQLLVNIFLNPIKKLNKKHIIDILKVGQKKRDYKNYNRFRLVIPAEEIEENQKKYTSIVHKLFPDDDKIHLHIIKQKQLKKILNIVN